jgi:hypothetical protein
VTKTRFDRVARAIQYIELNLCATLKAGEKRSEAWERAASAPVFVLATQSNDGLLHQFSDISRRFQVQNRSNSSARVDEKLVFSFLLRLLPPCTMPRRATLFSFARLFSGMAWNHKHVGGGFHETYERRKKPKKIS